MGIKNKARRRRILEARLKRKIKAKKTAKSVKKKKVWTKIKYS